jgi:PI-3-kinase-related kinase SMG-1
VAAGSSDTCSAGDYLSALAPVLLPLQQQLQAAEAAPQTPHEQRFQQQHLPRLRRLIEQLCAPLSGGQAAEPPAPALGPAISQQQQRQTPVALLRAAAAELAAALRAKQLSLAEVAPALAALADTGIPIPGVSSAAGGLDGPTLVCLAGEVAVLSTKTRPKRLRLLASDGSEHAFLLKARGGGGTGEGEGRGGCLQPSPRPACAAWQLER